MLKIISFSTNELTIQKETQRLREELRVISGEMAVGGGRGLEVWD